MTAPDKSTAASEMDGRGCLWPVVFALAFWVVVLIIAARETSDSIANLSASINALRGEIGGIK